jgi:hypothetical protein
MKIAFIHIGKTGGTTIHTLLKNNLNNYKEYHHFKNYKNDELYILWLRNPISRFVSAFNHSYYGVNVDVRNIQHFDLDNCLIPGRMKDSLHKTYIFSQDYDALIKSFESANHLAESLTSEDINLKNKAIELMNCDVEHICKGIGWYLNNGKLIENMHNKILFVGRMENMKEDIKLLSRKLNVNLNENIKLRENVYLDKSMKYLSPLAIKNIVEWYKDSDYAALKQLLEYEFIDEELFSSYFVYNNE